MIPPIYDIARNDTGVTALLGIDTRIYPWGEAPQGVEKPYAVWFTTSGTPENTLSCPPDMDLVGVQIDVYSDVAAQTVLAANALRTAIESQAILTAFRNWPREEDTRLYRFQLDVDFFVER